MKGALELAWDGEWYRRAYFDDGTPLGSAAERRVPDRFHHAVLGRAVRRRTPPTGPSGRWTRCARHLVRRDAEVVLLLTPAFDRGVKDPGYIKGYVPGIRENGGQYTHAAVWTIMALAGLGYGDEAVEVFHMINPINHTRDVAGVNRYVAEPYVIAGDVYAHPEHMGRAGWSWYTGSAGWLYRAGLESILGLQRRGNTFTIKPCVPALWSGFTIEWRFGRSAYHIYVETSGRRTGGVTTATVDGVVVDPAAIPLVDDGATHRVEFRLDQLSPSTATPPERVPERTR